MITENRIDVYIKEYIAQEGGSETTDSIKDQNSENTEQLKMWSGTQAQYDALESYDDRVLYFIHD